MGSDIETVVAVNVDQRFFTICELIRNKLNTPYRFLANTYPIRRVSNIVATCPGLSLEKGEIGYCCSISFAYQPSSAVKIFWTEMLIRFLVRPQDARSISDLLDIRWMHRPSRAHKPDRRDRPGNRDRVCP